MQFIKIPTKVIVDSSSAMSAKIVYSCVHIVVLKHLLFCVSVKFHKAVTLKLAAKWIALHMTKLYLGYCFLKFPF